MQRDSTVIITSVIIYDDWIVHEIVEVILISHTKHMIYQIITSQSKNKANCIWSNLTLI
jgi:hypothetical protein